jgi:hypothetical protein
MKNKTVFQAIPIARIKCAECGEFYATHQVVKCNIKMKTKDEVTYRLLCSDCAKDELLCLTTEAMG